MNEISVEISFQDQNTADSGRLASDLLDFLQSRQIEMSGTLQRKNNDAMDLGTTLAIVLGTPAAIALAKGIADWLKRQGEPAMVLGVGGKEVTIARGLTNEQKTEIALAAINSESIQID